MNLGQTVILSRQEQEYFLHVIEAAQQVHDRDQFFLWAQGQFQALLPHQIMVCMQFDQHQALARLDCHHATVLPGALRQRLCDERDGLAVRMARHGVTATLEAELRRECDIALPGRGIAGALVQGSGRLAGGATTAFALFGLPERVQALHTYLLQLLLPYLHLMMLRLTLPAAGMEPARKLSAREKEVLHWLREGKGNAEIASILGLSGFTVKNHLQRIYRTLDVANRTEAVTRASSLA